MRIKSLFLQAEEPGKQGWDGNHDKEWDGQRPGQKGEGVRDWVGHEVPRIWHLCKDGCLFLMRILLLSVTEKIYLSLIRDENQV